MKLGKYLFLGLIIPLNVSTAALVEEKLKIDITPATTTMYYTESQSIKKTPTSPYHALSPGKTNLLKPISKIEEKEKEKPERVDFEVIIPYKIKLTFDERLYHRTKREMEKITHLEKKRLKEILLENQKQIEEEEKRIEGLKRKIVEEEKVNFEEKMQLIEKEIEEELTKRKAKQTEEKLCKELATKKIEEENRRIEMEKRLKEQEEKRKRLEAKQKEKEQKRIAKLKKKELKKAKGRKQEEERRKKEEEERKKLAEYKELELDQMLDRQLPLGSQLNIDGRKVIDIKVGNSEYLSSTRRKKNEKPHSGFTSGVDINQELIVTLQGKVKDKINVKVDYSDSNDNKKQDFYINYQGAKNEVIQKVEFGDVKFTAPGTEFVGYNSQVFGVSAEANVGKKVKLWGIASRSKGIRVTKEFKGDKKIVNINRADTTYIQQKYYYLLPLVWLKGKNINPPITIEAVYIDDKNGNNNIPPKHIGKATAEISTIDVGTKTLTGLFDIQYDGEDYVFDRDTQIITFKQNVGIDYIVGVVFRDATGKYFPQEYSGDKNNPGTILMIEPGKTFIEYDIFELRNFYGIGQNIPLDTELKLKIIDIAGKEFFDKNNDTIKGSDEYYYLQIFGLDNDGDGKIDNNPSINRDYIDYTTGIIEFPDPTPFEIGTGSNPFLEDQTHINNLREYFDRLSISYNPNDDYSKRHKYTIIGSYTTKVKSYMLGELNILPGSEQVYIDGKLLTKDNDYFIDYDTGFLTFMPHINITEHTTIKIDYEYTPPFIGTRYQKTIAGLRGEFKANDNFSIGSTYLYEGAPTLKKIPKVSDPMLGTLHVMDVNTSVKITPMLKALFNLENNLPLEMTISGEVAKSFKNENTFGSSIIDSMEGVEEARVISMDEDAWQLGSLHQPNLDRGKLLYGKDTHGNLMTSPPYQDISRRSGPYDYKENVKWEEDDEVEENVLRLYYEDFGTNSWISIVQSLSNTPLDLSDYTYLEIWFKQPDFNKIDELYIDLGEVSEDADGTGTSLRPPKTEDTSPEDYILNKGEDVGWEFTYPDGITTRVGADNNQLDTEDLNGDKILNTKEEYFVLKVKEFKEKVNIRNQIGDWQLWAIPLSKAEIGAGAPRLTDIKHIRLRFKGAGTYTTGEIRIGGIALIGSGRWSIGTVSPIGGGTFNVSSKNAEDDADYQSIKTYSEYKDLYPDEDMKREEALVLKYALDKATLGTFSTGTNTIGTKTIYSKGYTYRTFHTTQNYNNYKYLRFWLYGNSNSDGRFFIRFGSDENNYFGYTLPIDFSGWKLITIDLDDFKDKLIELIEEGKKTQTKIPPYNYAQLPAGYEAKNNPDFKNIKWMSLGVENTSTTKTVSGEIYINDIHLHQARKSEGIARRITLNTKYKDYLSIKWDEKIVDSEFESMGRSAQNEDTKRQDVTVNFTKIKFLPIDYTWYNEIKKLDQSKRKENILADNYGKSSEKYHKISTNFKFKEFKEVVNHKYLTKLPNITINTWAEHRAINTARRNAKEDEIHEKLHGDTKYEYNYTAPKKIFKRIPTGEYLSLTSIYIHNEDFEKSTYQIETAKNSKILTRNQDETLTFKFTPIKTLQGESTIKAAQTLKKTQSISQNDTKYYLTSRTLEQTFREVVYKGIPFVTPRIDTGMKYVESYCGTATNRTRNVINTTAHLSITTERELNPFDWFPKLKQWPRYKLFTFTPEFTLDVTANYKNISPKLGTFECIRKIYNDYYKGQLLKGAGPKTGQYPPFGGERTSASDKRIYKLRSNWYTKWKPLENTTFNYTTTDEKSQNQSSISNTLTNSYDIDIKINLLTALNKYSKLLGSGPSDRTYFNTKYTWTKTQAKETTIGTDIRPSIDWTRKWKEGLDTIFKLNYQNSKTKKTGNREDFTLNITPSLQINYDIKRPKPVNLPFGRKITLQRRLNTQTIMKIDLQKEVKDNRVTKDMTTFSLDMSGSYELQKNVNTTLGAKIGYTRDKLEKEKDFYGYEGRVRVEFKF